MVNCKECLNEFVKKSNRKSFCSRQCQSKWAIKRASEKRKPKERKGVKKECMFCKKEFYIPQYRIEKAKYCSRSCLAKVHLEQFSHLRWKPKGKPYHQYKKIKIEGKWHREHRYIMEQHLGRKLESWEHVHHIDDNSLNNSLENLVVLSNSDHQKEECKLRNKLTSSASSS